MAVKFALEASGTRPASPVHADEPECRGRGKIHHHAQRSLRISQVPLQE
jgi:hypothetical protein